MKAWDCINEALGAVNDGLYPQTVTLEHKKQAFLPRIKALYSTTEDLGLK